jgi:hypothetical protein
MGKEPLSLPKSRVNAPNRMRRRGPLGLGNRS